MLKKGSLLLITLVAIPGCGGGRQKTVIHHDAPLHDTKTHVDIPVAGEQIKSFFDEDLGEFALVDDATDSAQELDSPAAMNEYAWVEEEGKNASNFKVVYFDFDKYTIKNTQEENVTYDVSTVKQVISEQLAAGAAHPEVKVVVEGHACHSGGSAIYNLALSEKRAKVVSDRLVACGVPREFVKIVGRGQEVPAIVNGKVATGSREQQWPNRRVELRILA